MLKHLPLFRTAELVVRRSVAVKPGEEVCIVTDTNKLSLAEALAAATVAAGGNPIVCVMLPGEMHGAEPPRIIAAAMKAADIILAPTTYSITHTAARLAASEAGGRTLILRSLTEETFTVGAITADLDDIIRLNGQLATHLLASDQVRVTTEKGSDLTFRVAGRPVLRFDGLAQSPGSMNGLPAGEVATSPIEGTAQGTLMVDHYIDMVGRISEPVTLVFEAGCVVEVRGGVEAQRLRQIWAASDANATNLAEFAIGTNPKSRMLGDDAEDKLQLGCVHVGLGDNHTIGGSIVSKTHLDAVVLRPTVTFDGREIVRLGNVVQADAKNQ